MSPTGERESLTRDRALAAKPVAAEILGREPLPGGGARVTVRFQPSGLQRWLLRAPADATRKFELDAMGLEVLALCDGKKSVRHIGQTVAKRHRVDPHEAELAVATFLRTMTNKGLVSMVVDKA